MTVLQLKHENVSKFATCGSDLLPIIASLQSGQLRIGGGSGGGIGTVLWPVFAQFTRLQVNPIQHGSKNAESTGHDEDHDHIYRH
jgi:hypothetical protein